jgi:hypothetical protein
MKVALGQFRLGLAGRSASTFAGRQNRAPLRPERIGVRAELLAGAADVSNSPRDHVTEISESPVNWGFRQSARSTLATGA